MSEVPLYPSVVRYFVTKELQFPSLNSEKLTLKMLTYCFSTKGCLLYPISFKVDREGQGVSEEGEPEWGCRGNALPTSGFGPYKFIGLGLWWATGGEEVDQKCVAVPRRARIQGS